MKNYKLALRTIDPTWVGAIKVDDKDNLVEVVTHQGTHTSKEDLLSWIEVNGEKTEKKYRIEMKLIELDRLLPRHQESIDIHEKNPMFAVKAEKIKLREELGKLND